MKLLLGIDTNKFKIMVQIQNFDLGKRDEKIVLWWKITRALKETYEPKNYVNNRMDNKKTDSIINHILETKDCENTPNPDGQDEVLPAPSEETCNGGCEILETHSVVAISARDMSVGAVIGDYPRNKMFINGYKNKK